MPKQGDNRGEAGSAGDLAGTPLTWEQLLLGMIFSLLLMVGGEVESDVRFGPKADVRPVSDHVCFYDGYFADPDFYVWQFAFNPFPELAGNGRVRLPDGPPARKNQARFLKSSWLEHSERRARMGGLHSSTPWRPR